MMHSLTVLENGLPDEFRDVCLSAWDWKPGFILCHSLVFWPWVSYFDSLWFFRWYHEEVTLPTLSFVKVTRDGSRKAERRQSGVEAILVVIICQKGIRYCISQGSSEKQNQQDVNTYVYRIERQWILRNWLLQLWGLASPECAGLAVRLEIPAGVNITVWSPKIVRRQYFFIFGDLSLFFLRAWTDWLRSTPITKGNLLYFNSIDFNVNHIFKKYIFTATCRLVFDKQLGTVTQSSWPVNHHRNVISYYGNGLPCWLSQ